MQGLTGACDHAGIGADVARLQCHPPLSVGRHGGDHLGVDDVVIEAEDSGKGVEREILIGALATFVAASLRGLQLKWPTA